MTDKEFAKPHKFEPTEKMFAYLEAYLTTPFGTAKETVCKKANVSRHQEWEWRKNPEYNEWFNGEVAKYMNSKLSEVWRTVLSETTISFPDRKLFLQRFDKDFSEKQTIEHPGNVIVLIPKEVIPDGSESKE